MPLWLTNLTLAALFTAPALAVAGAAAVGIPVAIHLLSRMRRRPVRWGAMRFLEIAYRQQKNKLRLESWLLLAVRCLIALILGLALSGPVLTGCAGSLTSGLDTSGRVVHIVIDDALSSTAQETAAHNRFDRHVAEAGQMIDNLEAGDRVALWASARPARAVIADPTSDRGALTRALDVWKPRFARSDLPAALESVKGQIEQDQVPAGRAVVAVLSDLAGASGYWSEPTPAALRGLGDRALVLVGEPSAEAGNVQLSALTPRRALVLARSPDGGSAGAVGVIVSARRFAAGSEPASAVVAFTLRDADGNVAYQTKREVRWERGQVETTLNVELPVETKGGVAAGPMVVKARLEAGSIPNAIAADNVLLSAVEVRLALNIGLIDDAGSGQIGEIQPGEFIARALAPLNGAQGSGMSVQTIAPGRLDEPTLQTLDAAMVLRPDLLPSGMWEPLARFAKRGGLVWVVVPRDAGSAVWTDPMRRAFDLDWRIGLEAVDLAAAVGGLGLDTGRRAPETLELVGAGWGELLRPVRVSRKLELLVPEDEAWLALEEKAGEQADAGAGQDQEPGDAARIGGARRALLAQRRVGEGSVLLLSAALDADWTNLPTKPLFVPLVHETLRGVLGSSPRGVATATAGDQPTLEAGWRDAVEIERPAAGDDENVRVELRPIGEGLMTTVRAMDQPGVYTAIGGNDTPIGGLLALNPDVAAGDTRPASEAQRSQWLNGLGPWDTLDITDWSAQIASQASRPNIGWALLWVVLGLVVLETILARTVSHAKRETGQGLGKRVLGGLRALRDVESSPDADASAGRAA